MLLQCIRIGVKYMLNSSAQTSVDNIWNYKQINCNSKNIFQKRFWTKKKHILSICKYCILDICINDTKEANRRVSEMRITPSVIISRKLYDIKSQKYILARFSATISGGAGSFACRTSSTRRPTESVWRCIVLLFIYIYTHAAYTFYISRARYEQHFQNYTTVHKKQQHAPTSFFYVLYIS